MNRTLEQIISIPLYLLFFPAIPTFTHWDMVKTSWQVKYLKKASYKEIKKKMLSVSWEYNPSYPTSLFGGDYPYENYFHASIFRFGDVGYLLTPYGYIRASLLQRKIRKTLPSYCKSIKPYIQ